MKTMKNIAIYYIYDIAIIETSTEENHSQERVNFSENNEEVQNIPCGNLIQTSPSIWGAGQDVRKHYIL